MSAPCPLDVNALHNAAIRQGCRVQTHLDHVDAVTLQGAIDRIDLVACDVPGCSRHDGGRCAVAEARGVPDGDAVLAEAVAEQRAARADRERALRTGHLVDAAERVRDAVDELRDCEPAAVDVDGVASEVRRLANVVAELARAVAR